MGGKFQEKGGPMLDLNMLKPVLRAYALGYASSTIPRLLGLLRTLRRQDRTIQEKLDLVSPVSRPPFHATSTSNRLQLQRHQSNFR